MRRRRLIVPILVLLLLAAAAVLFTDITGTQFIDWFPSLRLQRSRVTTSSSIVLREAHDVFSFNTVEFVYRSIFPFDFMVEGVSINDLLRKINRGEGSLREILSAAEFDHFQAFNLAAELGMSVGPGSTEFVVVTVVVTAGFDLGGTVFEDPESFSAEERARFFQSKPYEDESGNRLLEAVVRLPEAIITDVGIEDIRSQEYPYPDVQVNADGWRRISAFVGERIAQRTIGAGILEVARENGSEFLRSMLLQSGYDRVTILEQKDE